MKFGSFVQFSMLIRMMYISLASGVHGGRKTTAKICAWKSTWCNPFRDVIEGSWTAEPDTKCIWRPGKKPSYVVVGCSDRSGKRPGLSFHRFPKDPELHKRWTAAVRRETFHPITWRVRSYAHRISRMVISTEIYGQSWWIFNGPRGWREAPCLLCLGLCSFRERDSLFMFICWYMYNNCSLAQLVWRCLIIRATRNSANRQATPDYCSAWCYTLRLDRFRAGQVMTRPKSAMV